MPELASEAKVALVTPYTYFQSKAGVLTEVLDPSHALESASAWSDDTDHDDGLERVMAFARSRCDRYVQDGHFIGLWVCTVKARSRRNG